ncbi:MAG: cation:proton antiporter [Candidatus Woesebacteria bacterium]|nr:cation:proton antiporter [Candidatus Woesebacteria bacterium]
MPESTFLLVILVLIFASIGGFIAKKLKAQPLIGYLVSGIVLGSFFPQASSISKLSEIGIILLLFSLGLELSFSRLIKVFKTAFLGGILQIILFSLVSYPFFLKIGFNAVASLIFALSFSLSSSAVVVKILADRGETETQHGGVMSGWLLVQDLAVIPIVIFINSLGGGGGWISQSFGSFLKAFYVIVSAIVLGRHVVPYVFHKIASVNSRELLVISALGFSGAVAYLTSLLGISPSLGAFLAGLVISESIENHAVLGEIRPLRDLFVAIFFVTLGFLIKPLTIIHNFWLVMAIFSFTVIIKTLVNFLVTQFLGYRGKCAVSISMGLSQVGEFSFVIFSQSLLKGLVSPNDISIATGSVLLTIVITPYLFKKTVPFWKYLKKITQKVLWLNKYFVGGAFKDFAEPMLTGHIVICGYGRVGGWVGRALTETNTPFIIIDSSLDVVSNLKKGGLPVIFGDPAEPEVLEAAGIRRAKAVVVAIPDRISQEILISHVQTVAPDVKIISRVHLDSDWERLKILKVDKIVQPEFEAAIAITRSIFISMGKSREEIGERLKNLRISRSLK